VGGVHGGQEGRGGSTRREPGPRTDTVCVSGRAEVENELLSTPMWWQDAWLPDRKMGRSL